MAFGLDYSGLSENSLIPEGEYECVIHSAVETATDYGTPYININLRVRRDVEQEQQGRTIFHSLWMKKNPEPQDAPFGGYSAKQILSLSRAAGLAAGTKFNSLSDWCDALTDHAVRVTVYHDEYNGRTNARVRWVNETRYPEAAEPAPAPAAKPAQDFQPMPDDDDLPF